jgi:hypothetical protein
MVELVRHKELWDEKYLKNRIEQFENVKCDEKKVYDKAGKLIEAEYSRNGEFISRHDFTYDRKGNQIRHQFWQMPDDLECCFYSEYDKNNNKVKMDNWATNVPDSTVFYEYDAATGFSKAVARQLKAYYGSFDYSEYSISFVYDGDKPVEEQYFDKNGQMFLTVQYVYDSNNRLIEKSICDKGMLFCKIVLQYDENNRKSSAQRFLDEDFWQRERFSGIADFMG